MKGGDGIGQRTRIINEGDILHSRLKGFRRKVESAIIAIEKAAQFGKIGVSFSGGKDSTVLRDLVKQVIPDAPIVFYDSGAELKQTYAMMKNVIVIKLKKSLPELLEMGGYWGSVPTHPNIKINFMEALIEEPERQFQKEYGVSVQAIGLRADESVGRRINARLQGEFYEMKTGNYHLCPLAFWSIADVWAYIASRNLVYNEAYDIMQELGIARKEQRISTYFGSDASQFGRFAYLKKIDPELFNKFAEKFPRIRIYV